MSFCNFSNSDVASMLKLFLGRQRVIQTYPVSKIKAEEVCRSVRRRETKPSRTPECSAVCFGPPADLETWQQTSLL